MTFTELYPYLVQRGLVTTRALGPPPNPLPANYNAATHCLFHEGAPGHDLENCYALKNLVRDLMEKKILSFNDPPPNVKSNPLPDHGAVNAIDASSEENSILDVAQIKTPLKAFHSKLFKAGLVSVSHIGCTSCKGCDKGCVMVRKDVQRLIDDGFLQVVNQEKEVAAIEPTFNLPESRGRIPVFNLPAPNSVMPVFSIPTPVTPTVDQPKPLIIQKPSPFPFSDPKAVPWKYGVTAIDKESGKVIPREEVKVDGESVTNIAGASRMTRSGRVYTPRFDEAPPRETTTNTAVPARDKNKEVVTNDADAEFLRIIRKSDYKVVDQLHQTPSKISILSLLLNSPAHRAALQKVLTQAHVAQDITTGQFDSVIANITACNTLSFSNEELPKEGPNHNRALHISAKCQEDNLARVLVDTGSSLNVLPKRVLSKLAYKETMVKPTSLIVKAFDGSRRAVIGEVELPILIGPHVFNITFQVMDINPNYSCLLGRPWIHAAGAVTSTLHQKMKFVVDDKLVIIHGEEDLMVSNLSSFRYIEADEDALETSFQALEIANAVLVEVEETVEGQSNPSFSSLKSTRSIIDRGIPEGWGEIINVKTKTDRHGLGYRPTHDKASTNVEGRPKIYQEVFISGGFQVNAVSDGDEDDDLSNLVFKSSATLSNWEAIEIPVIFPVSK